MQKDNETDLERASSSAHTADARVPVELYFDSEIVEAYQNRWPNDWRDRMEEAITAAASKL
jgi:uncharacterized protein (DUF4415 family)